MIAEAIAAVKEIQEPIVTWNLFLTAFLVPTCSAVFSGLTILYISWRIRQKERNDNKYREEREKRETEIADLQKQLSDEKLRATIEWRKTHNEILCGVKKRVDEFYETLDNKVNKDDCDRLMQKG